MRIKRHPRNRTYLNLCIRLAEKNPDWTIQQVEAEATKESLSPGKKGEKQ
jgi:hypothetical protein